MAAQTGSRTPLVVTLSTTFDSVTQGATGHKLTVDSLTPAKGQTEITEAPIGSGLTMQQDSDIGDFNPTVSLAKTARDLDQGNALIAAFFGVNNVVAEGTGFAHSITYQGASITAFANLAYSPDTASVAEFVNGVVNQIQLTYNPNDYLKANYDLLFTNKKITGTTNTTGSLVSATEVSGRKNFIVRPAHKIRINAQAGAALADGDKVDITNAVVTFSQPRQLVGEIRNAAGYGTPTLSGSPQFSCEVTLTFKDSNLINTYEAAIDAGTEYKLDLYVQGDLISGTTYRQFHVSIPRAKIVTDAQFAVTNPGDNELTITFRALVASANPTGMISTYPYIKIVNSRSTQYWSN